MGWIETRTTFWTGNLCSIGLFYTTRAITEGTYFYLWLFFREIHFKSYIAFWHHVILHTDDGNDVMVFSIAQPAFLYAAIMVANRVLDRFYPVKLYF